MSTPVYDIDCVGKNPIGVWGVGNLFGHKYLGVLAINIRKSVKIFAVGLVVTVVSISILSGRLPVWVRWVIGGCALCGVCTIVFVVPTVQSGSRDT